MFSFHGKGSIKPIAEITGGENNKRLLYLHKKDNMKNNKGFFDKLVLEDGGKINYFPETRVGFTDAICVASAKGAGKSTFVAHDIAEKIMKVFGTDNIFLVKKKEINDPAYKDINPQLILVDENFEENTPTIEDLCGDSKDVTLVIFDDCDSIPSQSRKKKLITFQNECWEEGRKYNLFCVSIRHKFAGSADTKALLSDSNMFVWFPEAPTSDMSYVMENYFDISKDLRKDLKNSINSKWMIYSNVYPKYLLSETQAIIFDLDREDDRIKLVNKKKKIDIKNKAKQYERLSKQTDEVDTTNPFY